jgi:2,4-dienoyl-CoA reductase-like NADH-dependent reductase (Old Yellow Enzyme family)/thioredoxin reductase
MQMLSTELSVGNTVIKNRAIMAPIKTGYGVPTGEVTDRHLRFFERRSRHVGAVTPEPFCLHPTLRELPVQIGIHSDDMLPGLKRLADVIHGNGALAIAHLNHPGRMANPAIPGNRFLSSSGRMCPTGVKEPEAMDQSLIEESQGLFEKAAVRAEKAGYDFVELQFGHGYLIAQFLSEAVNDRTDQYGGNWENRLRYGLEVLERVKKAITLPIIVRLSADEMTPNGLGLEDAMRLAVALEERGANALHISSGSACETPPWYFQHMAVPKGKTWDFASRIREKVRIPVIAVGQINEREDPETILQNGMADAVAIGRALIADPDFVGKVLGKISDSIRPCASCLEGCIGGVRGGKGLMCVVNPAVGKDEEAVPTVERPRKVAVVGGGPAGMEAALVLDERGHDVTLYEKDDLGGLFTFAYLTPRKGNLKRISDYLIQEVQEKVPVVREEAGAEDLVDAYDAVIVATGSHPQPPDIPGLKEWNWAEILQEHHMPTGKKGLIVGGGFIGAEMAEALVRNGNDITILKRSKEIAPAMEPMARKFLLRALEELNIPVMTDTDVTKVEGGTVHLMTGVEEGSIEGVDFIVYTKGMVPEDSLKERLAGKVPVYSIGDCREIGRAMDAIHDAYHCAMSLG